MARTLVNSVIIKPATTAQVGDVVYSTLTEAQFQAQRDSTWVLMDGRDVTGSDYDTIVFNGLGGNIPDARGQFLRGRDHGRHLIDGKGNPDGDLDVGHYQGDAIRNIVGSAQIGFRHTVYTKTHTVSGALSWAGQQSRVEYSGTNGTGLATSGMSIDASRVVPTASDNRPKNTTVNIFIKINE